MQYRPVNINISIRVNSPGNNGSVVQTNVAVGVSVPTLTPASVLALPPVVTAAFAAEAPPGAAMFADTGFVPSAIALASLAGDIVEDSDDCCLLEKPGGVAFPDEAPVSVVFSEGTVAAARDITAAEGDTVAVVARFEIRARRAASSAAAPPRPQARPARPASTRGSAGSEDETAVVTSGFGIAPSIAAPDRTLPWVLLVLVSFFLASINASWASTRSRPTPGVDADDPPNPPG